MLLRREARRNVPSWCASNWKRFLGEGRIATQAILSPVPPGACSSGETSSHAIVTGTLNGGKKLALGESRGGSQAGTDVSTKLCGPQRQPAYRDKVPEETWAFLSFPTETLVSTHQSAVPWEALLPASFEGKFRYGTRSQSARAHFLQKQAYTLLLWEEAAFNLKSKVMTRRDLTSL